jgi:hypothetical protein
VFQQLVVLEFFRLGHRAVVDGSGLRRNVMPFAKSRAGKS